MANSSSKKQDNILMEWALQYFINTCIIFMNIKSGDVKPNGKTENWNFFLDSSLNNNEKPIFFCESICMSA